MKNLICFILFISIMGLTHNYLRAQSYWGDDPENCPTFTTGYATIGTQDPQNSKLRIETNWDGLKINHIHDTLHPWPFAFQIKVDHDHTKAITVKSDSMPLFRVWGNGVINAMKIYAEEIEVRPDAMGIFWPDFVFRSDYKLKSINELENFIIKNGHLPDVPSDNEIFEKGFNVAKMDALLLRKIEELTLYIIEQQKEIEKLKELSNNY